MRTGERNPYVDVHYIAERIGVSKWTVKRMIGKALRPPIAKVGRTPVWNKRWIDSWVERGGHLKRDEEPSG